MVFLVVILRERSEQEDLLVPPTEQQILLGASRPEDDFYRGASLFQKSIPPAC